MGRELGRISGPLLADNLKRNGANLAFDNQVLYLDVKNNRIGFNTATPVTDLYTPIAIDSVEFIVDSTADIGNFVVSGHTIQHVLNNSITISPNQIVNPRIITPGISSDNLYLNGNTISSYTTDSNINITANGTGKLNFANDSGTVQVTVNGNLHASGDITWDGNITIGNNLTQDTVTFSAEIDSNILPSSTNVDNLGSDPLAAGHAWATLYVNEVDSLLATFPNFTISENTIAGTVTNGTVNYTGFSGIVNAEYLQFSNTTITNNWSTPNTNDQRSIIFTPSGTGTVQLNTTTSLKLPTGTDSVRLLNANGELRFNNTNTNIEGYSETGYVNLFNLYSQDYLTYISPELTTGSADGTLRFSINGTVTTTIDSSKLFTNSLTSGNISVIDNTFSASINNDINFSTSGTGLVKSNGATFFDATNDLQFTNTSNGAYTLASTGYGYVKFSGVTGVVIPGGNTGDRPDTPEVGTTRFNSDTGHPEVYDASLGWIPIRGTNAVISNSEVNDITGIWALVLGL
jgi:hypothetical protein